MPKVQPVITKFKWIKDKRSLYLSKLSTIWTDARARRLWPITLHLSTKSTDLVERCTARTNAHVETLANVNFYLERRGMHRNLFAVAPAHYPPRASISSDGKVATNASKSFHLLESTRRHHEEFSKIFASCSTMFLNNIVHICLQ